MAKIAIGLAEIAGAVALDFFSGGIGAFLNANTAFIDLSQGVNLAKAAAMTMGAMGAGMTMEGIAQSLQGGGQGLSQSIKGSSQPRVTIYGKARVAGVVLYAASDVNNTYNQVIGWASHPIKSIDALYLDGRQFYPASATYSSGEGYKDDGGDHYDASSTKYNFKSNAYAVHHLGGRDGHWFKDLGNGLKGITTADANWTNDCLLCGIASTYLATIYNTNIWSNFPQAKATISGKCDIYDPRLGDRLNADGTINTAAHVWTDNAALVIADFLTNSEFGMGLDWADVDVDRLIAAANICDELVPLASGAGSANANLGAWAADAQYRLGQEISVNNYLYTVTSCGTTSTQVGVDGNGRPQFANVAAQSGLSGASAPNWPTTAGQNVNDGALTWACQGAAPTGWTASSVREKRYTINGSFQWSSTPGEICSSLLDSCEARITQTNGLFQLWPAAWYGSTLQFGEDDLAGEVKWTPKRKLRDLCNEVRAMYVCPNYPYAVTGYDNDHKDTGIFNGCWQPTDMPPYAQDALHGYASDANLEEDGLKLVQDRRYQFVTSVGQAQRCAKIYLMRNRRQGGGTLRFKMEAYQSCAQDVIQMNFDRLGWSAKYLELQSLRLGQQQSNDGDGVAMFVECDVVETGPGDYAWSMAEEMTQDARQSPVVYSENVVTDLTGVTVASSTIKAIDGSMQRVVDVTWNQTDDIYTLYGGKIQVRWERTQVASWTKNSTGQDPILGTTGITYTHTTHGISDEVGNDGFNGVFYSPLIDGASTSYRITGLLPGDVFSVTVRAQHANGAAGNWVG